MTTNKDNRVTDVREDIKLNDQGDNQDGHEDN
jgi:hypothetical protein